MTNAGAFKKGEKRPGQGRPKGSLTRHTTAVKDAIAAAAEGLGGTERLIAWAQEDKLNERAFWSSIYPKLLPLQVTGAGGGPLVARIELVALDADGADSAPA
jgi:hypothetical protein